MDTKETATAVNPEEELKKLREKTGDDELAELKHGLLGGYRRQDVALYVGRLKGQLQTAEKTFKNHIVEITAEKDQLRYERDTLIARLTQLESVPDSILKAELQQAKRAAEGFLADKGTLEEKLHAISRMSDESIAEMQAKTESLEEQLRQAQERIGELQAEKDGIHAADMEAFQAEKNAMKMEMEGLQVQFESYVNKSEENEHELRSEIDTLNCRIEAEKALSSEYHSMLEESGWQIEDLNRDNTTLSGQLEVARQNIRQLLSDKEVVEGINEQLRMALNSLVVKADAVIKENNVVGSLLDAERERVQQYQAMNDRLSDMLARVHMANQLLDERVVELDKALSWGNGQMSKANPGTPKRNGKADMLDFTDGKNNSFQEIITELNSIQASLSQYQQPSKLCDDKSKKPNIRYSVEKLEVDCPPTKPQYSGDSVEDFRLPVQAEYGVDTR